MTELIDTMIDLARNSLGDFCMNECKALCCRKGTLPISQEESMLFENKKTESGEISIVLPCEKLEDTRCLIYSDRPKICREYPIKRDEKNIMISGRCTAVMQGRLYPFILEFKKEGFEVTVN